MSKISFFILLFLAYIPLLFAQETIKLWQGCDFATKKMAYSEITTYLADNNPSGTAVIICPGGSYCYLGMKNEGRKVAEWLQKNGISAFVLRYRVGMYGNRHPAMVQDLQRAIQLIKEDHFLYGIDTVKIGVMGFSAGGHLVGMAATYFKKNYMESLGIIPKVSLRPNFTVMIYPVVSMLDSLVHRRSRANLLGRQYTTDEQNQMSLELNVHKELPPVFMIHCHYDKTVDYRNTLYYQKALENKGIPYHFRLYEEAGHGFGIKSGDSRKKAPEWIEELIPWLKDIRMIN